MASEDSRKHLVEWPEPSSTFASWIHRIHLPNDLSETVVPKVLLPFHHLEYLFEALERLPLTAERYDVPVKERNDALAQENGRRDLVCQDVWTT